MSLPPHYPPPLPVQPLSYAAMLGPSKDAEHLHLLSIFHYVLGGLTIALSCIAIVHITLGIVMASHPAAFVQPQSPAASGTAGTVIISAAAANRPSAMDLRMTATVGWVFLIVGGCAMLYGWATGICMIGSGRCLARHRRRTFSIVIAAIICLQMPAGTVLGVFTLVVLMRDSVRRLYEAATP